jgi:polysaccharide export outer membrane protein
MLEVSGQLRRAAGRSMAFIVLCGGAAFAQDRALDGSGLALKMTPALAASARSDLAPTVRQASLMPRLASAKDYRIGSEDLIEIQVFGVEQLSRSVRVNANGMVSLPLIGVFPVAGFTAQEAEVAIAARLARDYMQDPQVSVFIKEFTTQRVTVEGAVNKPGIYPLRGETTLLRTLAIAGGQGGLSDMSEVMVFRADASGQRVGVAFDVERIRRGEIDDPTVVNDDVIVVNRSRVRTLLKDSALRDALDAVNPFSPLMPK